MPAWSIELNGVYRRYPSGLSDYIEDAYLKKKPGACFKLRGKTYCISFGANLQVRADGLQKRVRRELQDVNFENRRDDVTILMCQRSPASSDVLPYNDDSFGFRLKKIRNKHTPPVLERDHRDLMISLGIPLFTNPLFEGDANLRGLCFSITGYLPLHTANELSNALINAGATIHTSSRTRGDLIIVRGYDPDSVWAFVDKTGHTIYPGLVNSPTLRKQLTEFPHTLVVDEYMLHTLLMTSVPVLQDWARACKSGAVDTSALCNLTDAFYTKESMRVLRDCVGGVEYIQVRTVDREKLQTQNHLAQIFDIGPNKARLLYLAGCTSANDLNDDVKGPQYRKAASLSKATLRSVPFYNDFSVRIPRDEITNATFLAPLKIEDDAIVLVSTESDQYYGCLMGSYRRGRESCGDIDILLTDVSGTTRAALTSTIDAFSKTLFQRICGGGVWTQANRVAFTDARFKSLADLTIADSPAWWELQHEMIRMKATDDPRRYIIVSPTSVQEQQRLLRSSRTLLRIVKEDGVEMSPTFRNNLTHGAEYVELDTGFRIRKAIAKMPGKMARRVDIKGCYKYEEAFARLELTGSDRFNERMREAAAERGWTLNGKGLFPGRATHGQNVASLFATLPASTERDVFDLLQLTYVDPANRTGLHPLL